MKYKTIINGIEVEATYSEESIREIFVPLLLHLKELQEKKGDRVLCMLAAPPGAGKSTLLEFLQELSKTDPSLPKITVIGMDGFHRYQGYLLTHTTERDGRRLTMVEIKGAPETFDLERLTTFVKRVAAGEDCGWPTYNRMTHNPQDDAIFVTGDIVILEGNYLLLDWPGWRDLSSYADYTVSLSADLEFLRKRLEERKIASGTEPDKARAFVEFSDLYNARTVTEHSKAADLSLCWVGDHIFINFPAKNA